MWLGDELKLKIIIFVTTKYIGSTKNLVFNDRSKDNDVKYHFVLGKVLASCQV